MVTRTIEHNTFVLNSSQSDYYGRSFKKIQRGGDWPVMPKPEKASVGYEANLRKGDREKLKSVVSSIRQRLRVSNSRSEKKVLRRALASARSELSQLRTAQFVQVAATKQRNAALRARVIESRRLRKEENHDYYMALTMESRGVGDVTDSNGNTRWTSVSMVGLCGWANPPYQWTSNDDIALTNKLLGQIARDVNLNVATSLAEADRTVAMIGDLAKKLARSLKKASTGDLLGAARILVNSKNNSAAVGSVSSKASTRAKWLAQGSSVRDRYLQYQFGIKPLIADVQAAARALAWLNDRPKYTKVIATRDLESKGSEFRGFGCQCLWEVSEKARFIAFLKAQPPAMDVLGVNDIASALWERTFLSFVIDWWVPVGAYLQALQAARTLSSVSIVKTTTTRTKLSLQPDSRDGWHYATNMPNERHVTVVNRSCSVGLSVPLPSVKPLFHKNTEVRIRHTLESIALIHLYGEKTIARRDAELRAETKALGKQKRFVW